MKVTIKQLAEKTGYKPTEVSGFIKTLVHIGWVEVAGEVKSPSGKGKPAILYELDEKIMELLGLED